MITDHFLVNFLLCSLLICATVGDTIGNGTIGGEKSCWFTQGDRQLLCRTLYMRQNFGGSGLNQVVLGHGNLRTGWGTVAINDFEIVDGLYPNAKVVARAQGIHFGADMNKQQWYSSQNILFEDDTLKGSSLEVRGPWIVGSAPFQWAIVGGTGELIFAQGFVSGKIVKSSEGSRIMKLSIRALYHPMENSDLVYSE